MIIRELKPEDEFEVLRIYNEYFDHLEYPDFYDKSIVPCPFVVTDDDGKLILAGGVKLIAEAVVVSDQDRSKKDRFEALLQALGSTIFIAQGMKHQKIFVFVQGNEKYVQTLQKFDFKPLDAKLLVLDFEESNGKAKGTSDTNS